MMSLRNRRMSCSIGVALCERAALDDPDRRARPGVGAQPIANNPAGRRK